jgi:hypothetical protein
VKYDDIHKKLGGMGETLNIEHLYIDKRGKPMEFSTLYKIGKFGEPEKKDLLLRDIEKKHEYIIDLIRNKEHVEEQLAAFASIHNIYVYLPSLLWGFGVNN